MIMANPHQRNGTDEAWEELRQNRLKASRLKKEISDKQIELAQIEYNISKFFMEKDK